MCVEAFFPVTFSALKCVETAPDPSHLLQKQSLALLACAQDSLGLLHRLVGMLVLYWSNCTILVCEKVSVWLSGVKSVQLLPECVVPLSCQRTACHFSEQSGLWLTSSQATREGGSKQAGFVGSW